ncbi:MAG TPA: DoxX family membrane protein, partial [Bacteroidales bacterium]|nr:DoxX family membrane protein [Bacteroidales bacterium]
MNTRKQTFEKAGLTVIGWMERNGLMLLRISIGIIFFWFGFLKFFEGLSPAEDLAIRTIDTLTFNLLPVKVIIYGLAIWEVLIGLGMIINRFMRATLLLLFLQMLGTFTPLFLFPSEVFHVFPVSLTLEGQ